MRSLLIIVAVACNALLGLRGLWEQDVNFFTQHPYSDPAVSCVIDANADGKEIALPNRLYRNLPGQTFTSRLYLEQIPYFEEGLTAHLRTKHPAATVHITCTPLS